MQRHSNGVDGSVLFFYLGFGYCVPYVVIDTSRRISQTSTFLSPILHFFIFKVQGHRKDINEGNTHLTKIGGSYMKVHYFCPTNEQQPVVYDVNMPKQNMTC